MKLSYRILFIYLLGTFCFSLQAQQYSVTSPSGELQVNISVGSVLEYSVLHKGDVMLDRSPISIELADGKKWGVDSKLSGTAQRTVNETFEATVYKRKQVRDHYNELTLKFRDGYDVIFRAYDEGMAYRFVAKNRKPFIVENEQAEFRFPGNQKAYIPYVQIVREPLEEQFYNSFENTYIYQSVADWDKKRLAFLPLVVEGEKGKKVCITESDLINYPGMYLYNGEGNNSLKAVFAPYPKEITQGGHNMLQGEVQSRESYIARFNGPVRFPWRIVIVAENDYQLADNDMVYKLAAPASEKMDYSWVKPGKVAWDWWNDWNIYNVDFRSGINNETYKYYIDFASQYGIEYVILDEGWSVNLQADLFQVVHEINLEELVAYATERNVGLILWAGYYAFNKDVEGICKHYSEMGIKGFKVDFMDRDDQPMVEFHSRTAEIAARYKMLLDYHGSYKPTGLQRTYPNVINFEGVHGLEQMKWSDPSVDQVTYDVTMPFIRMVAGPVDYTQGAMRNASLGNYHPVNSEAMSQGTRCRQLAEYIIFESPLNMLCDSPSNYMAEEECTEFIATVPTVWDNTLALNGKIAEYITIARQKGNEWYVGSLTNWNERELELDLSFLEGTGWKAEVYKDGVNANRIAKDYKKEIIDLSTDKKLTIRMAPGGGFVMKLYQ